jgi:hypothetical protein
MEPGLYAEGVLQVEPLWRGVDALLVHADVIFSRAAIEMCLADATKMRFIGRIGANRTINKNYGEMFAMRIPATESERFGLAVRASLDKHRSLGRVGIWQIYYEWTGFVRPRRSEWSADPNDWTDDVDTAEDLAYLPQLRQAALAEEPT